MRDLKIRDLLNKPWAITPEKFQSLLDVHDRHARGEKFDVAGMKATLADREKAADQGSYTVDSGVGIMPIEGVLAKRMDLMTFFSGGISTEAAQETLAEMLADDQVHSIILSIDSPGGEVDGTENFADAVAASTKPIVAYVDGQACSGAYWIASQCDAIYAAHNSTVSGSIGVVMSHVDRSKANEMAGKVITDVTAGKYKRVASSNAPLSQEGRQSIQDMIDPIYTVFVDAVAKGRGVSVDTVLADMADGRVFVGDQAIKAGLVDGVATLPQVIAQLNSDFQKPASAAAHQGGSMKTYTEAQFNEAVSAAEERGKASAGPAEFERGKAEGLAAGIEQGKAEGMAAGAKAERERIQAIEAEADGLPGHEKLVASLKFDGKTTGEQAATAILRAEKKLRADHGANLAADANAINISASAPGATDAADQARAAAENGGKKIDVAAHSNKIKGIMARAKAAGQKISFAEAEAEAFAS